MAQKAGLHVVSHRSGETEDATIADIAVATKRWTNQDWSIKPHRLYYKYNHYYVLKINQGDLAVYQGLSVLQLENK